MTRPMLSRVQALGDQLCQLLAERGHRYFTKVSPMLKVVVTKITELAGEHIHNSKAIVLQGCKSEVASATNAVGPLLLDNNTDWKTRIADKDTLEHLTDVADNTILTKPAKDLHEKTARLQGVALS